MALNLQTKYPGRFDPVSADYPQGKFKNRSSPTAQDGSYMERDWLNDWNAFFGALLANAGVSPNGNVDTAQSSQMYDALLGVIDRSKYFKTGEALPTKNIGPIWHDDYADWMTWQTFNQNGANYTGYASRLIGGLLLDTQPTPRAGYIKSGVQNLSRTTYAALRAWAMHNGLMVAPGVWSAGTIQCADNADGTTYRIYDVRGEFLRAFDDNRGVDVSRQFGTNQGDASRPITALIGRVITTGASEAPSGACAGTQDGTLGAGATNIPLYRTTFDVSRQAPVAPEFRPRNTSLLAAIKF